MSLATDNMCLMDPTKNLADSLAIEEFSKRPSFWRLNESEKSLVDMPERVSTAKYRGDNLNDRLTSLVSTDGACGASVALESSDRLGPSSSHLHGKTKHLC